MTNGLFPVPYYSARRQGRLDHELARGADPAASAALTRRAAQLLSTEERSRVANRLTTFLGDARGPNLGAFRTKTRARHAAIRDSADDLAALAVRLRGEEPITVRGAAMTALLVNGPLRRGDGHHLLYAVRAALVALDTPDRDAPDLAAAA